MKDKAAIKPKTSEDQLVINEDFANKFNYEKKRQALEKAQLKFGKNFDIKKLEGDAESSSSEAESEDSEGEMINEKVMSKFLETYIKLKDDNAAKDFLEDKKPVFTDEDFISNRTGRKKSKDKIEFGVNDALLNYKEGEEKEDIYSLEYQAKKIVKIDPEKEEFLKKLQEDEGDNGGEKSVEEYNQGEEEDKNFIDDGGFLKVKRKSSIVVVDDENDNATNTKEDEKENTPIENLDLTSALSKAKIKPEGVDMTMLQKIWGDETNLDKNEKFLRNYILSEAWLENDENRINKHLLLIDKEDEEKDDEFDEYEFKYNHRFEEEGGANITTYQRNIADSYRIKDESRKEKRKQTEQRKLEEKEKIKTEIALVKEAKKEQIKNKLEAIERIAGTEKIKEIVDELEDEFDSEKFDEKMNKIFNKEYYEGVERDDNIKEDIDEKGVDYKNVGDQEEENGDDNIDYNIEDEEGEDEYGDNEGENQWFYCDQCRKAIKENKIKYECEKCDDFVICKECFKSSSHAHKMKKSKVPLGCKPPENWKEILENMGNNNADNDGVLTCTNCISEITANYYFVCKTDGCEGVKICKTCRGVGKSVHEHKLKKFYIEEVEEETVAVDPKEKLNSILDNVYSGAADDIIDKKIATKFHYTKVEKDDIGISDEMLILLDDKTLNKYVPLRKLAPYNEKFKINDWQKKKMQRELAKELERKKKEFEKIKQQTEENIERNTKLLQNKRRFNKGEIKDIKKKKRLETYGIIE